MALAALLGALTIASSIALLAASAYIIARAALRPSIADLQVAIVGVRFFGIARGVFRYLERLVSHEANFRLLARLRVWFYTALEPLAPARLAHHRGGDLLARIVADIDTLEHFYVRVLAPPVVALLIALLMGIFLSAYDVRLALAVLAVLALAGVGVPLLTRYLSRDAGQVMAQTRGELNAALLDGIQGSADVVAFGQQEAQLARIQGINRQLSRWQRRMARIRGLDAALGALLVNLAATLVLALVTPLVRAGQIEGVDVAVLALATMASFESVLGLPMAFQYLGSSLAAGRRLFEIVDEKPVLAAQDYPQAQSPPSNFDLVFENVTFRYTADSPPALDSVGFTLRQGRRLAIVGSSGAGKSTLVNLLLRFWDYEQGFIALGGRDIRDYDPEHLRSWIAVVSQNTYLFNTTVRENILLGRQNASEAEMIEAARQAQIHDFITTLPGGYDTWVGEQGLRLSGGERQRIAIARALLKDAPVLVLDEATTGLDSVTERDVITALYRLMEGRTVLMITHRLTGLQAMDEILVLHEGKLAERGTHAGLVQSQGRYFKMSALQNESLR